MNPGRLRHRVTIQEYIERYDDFGTPLDKGWKTVSKVWASVEPISGREYVQLHNTEAEITTRIKMRYLKGVKPNMQVLYDGREFDIQSVLDIEERHIEMHLMCVEKVKTNGGC